MFKVDVTIKGISPILFHRFPEEDFESSENVKPSKRGKANPTKEEQVEKSLYRLEDGRIYTPGEHLVGALIKAGAKFIMKGRSSFKEAMFAGVFVEPMKIVHKNQKYLMDWRSIVNNNNKARVMCGRGRLDEWELDFTLVCIDDRVTATTLKEILMYAGNYIGIGAYRPRYGRFEVVNFKEIK